MTNPVRNNKHQKLKRMSNQLLQLEAITARHSVRKNIDKPIEAEKIDDTESFKTLRSMAESGMFPELTLDEINKEIALARSEKN